ncbi:MAG: pteridine reductase [Pseudomarimonas sp.]
MNKPPNSRPVALVTGAAKRIGATIAQHLHVAGYDLVLHYRESEGPARELAAKLEAEREGSTLLLQCDLAQLDALVGLIDATLVRFGRLDALVNNASSYYRTPVGSITRNDWDALFSANAMGPLFLTQAASQALRAQRGCVVNIVDIYAERPLEQHTVYCMAKAALGMMTQSLARELGPEVRVNGVAPGNMLWSENPVKAETLGIVVDRTALRRQGQPLDVAEAVRWLIVDAPYVTGQIIRIDGGRSLFI